MTLLDMQRENLKKAREKLMAAAHDRATRFNVDLEQTCNQRQTCKDPKKKNAADYRAAVAFFEEHYLDRWRDFCRQCDILHEIELKGWQ
jgi:hypothetical protein